MCLKFIVLYNFIAYSRKNCNMLLSFVLLNILAVSYGMPYVHNPQNVITVPPNCPPGQELINGVCRDIWFKAAVTQSPFGGKIHEVDNSNIITVPPNCPPGQEYINGACRDVWRKNNVANSLFVNQNLEQLWNDLVRKIQESRPSVIGNANADVNLPKNIINVPKQCPIGYRPDANGNCRPIF